MFGLGELAPVASLVPTCSYFPARSVLPVASVVGLSCGGNHAAAVSGSEVAVWGSAKALGVNSTNGQPAAVLPAPTRMPSALFQHKRVTSVSAGWGHTAFVTDCGRLYMAGDGTFGQLGLGPGVTSAGSPEQVKGMLTSYKVVGAACGMHHTLVLAHAALSPGPSPSTSTAVVLAFGANRRGQAGVTTQLHNGLDSRRATCMIDVQITSDTSPALQSSIPSKAWEPYPVCGLRPSTLISQVVAGGHHSGALDRSGCLYLWGRSYVSQHDSPLPERVPHFQEANPARRWTQVSLGWSHALGLDDQGTVWAWGSDRYGQCGQPMASKPQAMLSPTEQTARIHPSTELVSQPTKIDWVNLGTVACVAAGSEHSAAVTSDGRVFAWGWGEHGQLGCGGTESWCHPEQVDVPACVHVSCGTGFTIAIQKDS